MTGPFTDHVETAQAHILAKHGAATYDLALFLDNAWWTDTAVSNLVGQRPNIRDEATGRVFPGRIVKAWKRDGMVCIRIEPAEDGDDEE